MRRRSSTLLALATIGLAASQASAADLPRKAPAYVPPAPPPYVWTGCYIGGNVGAAFAHIDVTDVVTGASGSRTSDTSFAGGGQIGCDYQFYNSWVVGIRNMFDATDIHRSRTFSDPLRFPGVAGTIDTRVRWFDALTARLGYLVAPNWLIYGQGGAAWTSAEATANINGIQVASISGNSRTGWTAGGGVEWMFVPHWSLFLEYNYMGFGTRSSAFLACGSAACGILSAKANVQDVLVGVNYKF